MQNIFFPNLQIKVRTTNDKKRKQNTTVAKRIKLPLSPQISIFESPKPVSIVPYLAKRDFADGIKLRIL